MVALGGFMDTHRNRRSLWRRAYSYSHSNTYANPDSYSDADTYGDTNSDAGERGICE